MCLSALPKSAPHDILVAGAALTYDTILCRFYLKQIRSEVLAGLDWALNGGMAWVEWPRMAHGEDPRMDELKKLLRRLDGLDGNKSLAKTAQQADAQQRGYVGALRGAPVGRGQDDETPKNGDRAGKGRPSRPAIYAAALTAAVISTVSIYLMMSSQATPPQRATGLTAEPAAPGTFDPDAPKAGRPDARDGDMRGPRDLVRKAEREARPTGAAQQEGAPPAPGGKDF